MSKLLAKTLDSDLRALDDGELDFVTGGIIDGCIRMPTIAPFSPLPPTAPWFDSMWVQVGKTGTLPH